jgi:hypothetical protein
MIWAQVTPGMHRLRLFPSHGSHGDEVAASKRFVSTSGSWLSAAFVRPLPSGTTVSL